MTPRCEGGPDRYAWDPATMFMTEAPARGLLVAFKTYLSVRMVDETTWELERDLIYEGKDDYFLVPKETTTDFASVPRPFWWLIPRYGRYTEAAVLHDYLCNLANDDKFSRCDADGIFRRVLRELGVGYVRRRLMWAAVRWGGGVLGCGWPEFFSVLLITVLALPLLVPAVIVLVSLLVFWAVSLVVWGIRRLFGWEETSFPRPFPR